VRNIDSTNSSGGAIIHQVEVNVYYKSHVERMRIDVCDLGRTDIILGIPWLQVYNLKINWETEEVKMTRCPPICRRNIAAKQKTEKRRKVEGRIRAVGKSDRDEWKLLIEEKFDNEVEVDREKVRKMVPQRFHKWLKVFKKAGFGKNASKKTLGPCNKSERRFVPRKRRTYLMLREEKEKIREFVEEQLRKGYIRPSKLPQTSPVFFVGKKDGKKRMV